MKVDCISEERAQESNRFLAFRLDPLSYALLLAKWERNIIWEYEKYTLYRIREIHYIYNQRNTIESEKCIHIKRLHFTVGAGDWILFQSTVRTVRVLHPKLFKDNISCVLTLTLTKNINLMQLTKIVNVSWTRAFDQVTEPRLHFSHQMALLLQRVIDRCNGIKCQPCILVSAIAHCKGGECKMYTQIS